MIQEDFFFRPRHFRENELWENIQDDQWQDPAWQIRNSIRDIDTLSKIINLSDRQKQSISRTLKVMESQGKEPMRITPYYASLMARDPFNPVYPDGSKIQDNLDPIFWQSVPTPAHLHFPQAGVEQSMAEADRSYGAFYQRYPNRGALFVCENTSCATFCTHCQRTKSLDGTSRINKSDLDKGLFYIARNKNINEVLVTGGDALRISQRRFEYVIGELCRMPNVRVIRIATRVPVVMPMGVTHKFLDIIDNTIRKHLNGRHKNVYFMTHINHYHEITPDFFDCIQRIRQHGYAIRNQTVLLNHVNADFHTLSQTFSRMWWAGVGPYYLLQCHNERGLAHFIAPIPLGKLITSHLHGWISGMCRPTYSANLEGGGGKVTLTPSGFDVPDELESIGEELTKQAVTIHTWDDRIINDYEALGRASQDQYDSAIREMDEFIGRSGLFNPAILIVDQDGNPVRTTVTKLPDLNNTVKSDLLGYTTENDAMPLTNPATIKDTLDEEFLKSKYNKQIIRNEKNDPEHLTDSRKSASGGMRY